MLDLLISFTGFIFGLLLTFIAPEELKPGKKYFLLIKEILFFLIIFFFSLGASFDLDIVKIVLLPAALVATLVLLGKPIIFRILLRNGGEASGRSGEIGVRLGQISEFSLLIAVLAYDLHIIGERASYLIQVATLLTFIVSSYYIVMRYPTPIALDDKLRRD